MTTAQATNKDVRAARMAAGLAQEALAMRLGISRPTVVWYERYGRPLPRGITAAEALAAIADLVAEGGSTAPSSS